MPLYVPDDRLLDWQRAYAQELRRTSGKTVLFQELGGGWYRVLLNGTQPLYGKQRRSNVEQMTEALRLRPDHRAA